MQSTVTKPQGKFSKIIQLYHKAKFVFFDYIVLKKGNYLIVYPPGRIFNIARFFNYYPDKEFTIDRIEYDGIPTVYINDYLIVDFQ